MKFDLFDGREQDGEHSGVGFVKISKLFAMLCGIVHGTVSFDPAFDKSVVNVICSIDQSRKHLLVTRIRILGFVMCLHAFVNLVIR